MDYLYQSFSIRPVFFNKKILEAFPFRLQWQLEFCMECESMNSVDRRQPKDQSYEVV